MSSAPAAHPAAPAPAHSAATPHDPAQVRRALAWFLGALTAGALGALAAAVLLIGVILPVGGPHLAYGRILALADHLAPGGLAGTPTVAVLGNSIHVEGVDAAELARGAPPGWSAENYAVNGCELTEARVILPRLLAAGPRAVVLGLRPLDLGEPSDIPMDKARLYAIGGYAAAWPEAWRRDPIPGLSRDTFDLLVEAGLRAQLALRTAPALTMNDAMRAIARSGIRAPAPDDWISPYQMTASISGNTLEKHIAETVRSYTERSSHGDPSSAPGAGPLRDTLAMIRDAGAVPILAIQPTHPRVLDHVRPQIESLTSFARTLADAHGGLVVDASEALSEREFADAIHPNAEGRAAYSRALGRALPPLPTSPVTPPHPPSR